jgi:hypothetical protein
MPGLLNEAGRALADELREGLLLVVAAGQHHPHTRTDASQLPEGFYSAHLRHREIEDDETDLFSESARKIRTASWPSAADRGTSSASFARIRSVTSVWVPTMRTNLPASSCSATPRQMTQTMDPLPLVREQVPIPDPIGDHVLDDLQTVHPEQALPP